MQFEGAGITMWSPPTYCGQVISNGGIELVNITSDNGLITDGTKPLTEPMFS